MSTSPKRGLPLWAGLLYASIAAVVVIPGWLLAHDDKPADLPSCDLEDTADLNNLLAAITARLR